MSFFRCLWYSRVVLPFVVVVALLTNGCGNTPQGPSIETGASETTPPRSTKLLGGVIGDVLTLNVDDALGSTVSTTDALLLNPNSQVESDSDMFSYNQKGDLWTRFGFYANYQAGDIQVLEAEFQVDRYSVPKSSGQVEIVMTVTSGTTLDDIAVAFDPHGFNFLPNRPATLKLTLRGKNVPETRDGYHIHDPDHVEKIEVAYEEHDGLLEKRVTITMKVPGFSRYILGGGGRDR